MSTLTDTPAATAPTRILDDLPHASLLDAALGFGPYLRPNSHRSRLHHLGERFVIDLPGFPKLLVTSSVDDAKVVLADRDQALSFGQVLARFTPHDVLFGEDTFIFLEGDQHLFERRMIGRPFHGAALKSYETAMEHLTDDALETWPKRRPAKFLDLGYRLAMDVMLTVLFGVGGERRARLEAAMRDYCGKVHELGFLALAGFGILTGHQLSYRPLIRGGEAVDAIILEEIAERRRTPDVAHDDCLALYMEMNADEGTLKDDATIARGMRGLVLAGFETTGITLSWVGEYLSHHPEALAEIHRSIDAGDDEFVDAAIAETMRLRPAIPLTGRRALKHTVVNGVEVPKGAVVVLNTMRVHERPDVYEEPLAFKPERYLGERPGTYTWLTFGGGAHRCMGGAFALFEARVLIRTILRSHTIEPEAGPVAACRVSHAMLIPRDGALITLNPR